jgi:U3 small nucleolar RNA-associated protein MPP10
MLEYALDGTEEPTKSDIASTTDDMEQDSPEDDDSDSSYRESDGDSENDEEAGGSSDGELPEEGVSGLRDESVDREEEGSAGESRPSFPALPLGTKGGHPGLNDNFFDLEEFNAETEEAEAAFVSNGALDADSDDNEDDIDYFASINGQLHADDDHGRSTAPSIVMRVVLISTLVELRYSDFFDAPPYEGERKKGARPGASAPLKVRFHDEVKVKTIKARGKGLPLSIMRLLDNEPDDDDGDSFETESEDESDDSQRSSTQDNPGDDDSDTEFSGDENPGGEFTISDGHRTIKRLQDDLLADEDEPDDGMLYSQCHILDTYV